MIRTIGASIVFLGLAGCVAMPDYAQYDAAVDHYSATERFASVSVAVDTQHAGRISADTLRTELAAYLSQYGIETRSQDADVRIELAVAAAPRGQGRSFTGAQATDGDMSTYSIASRMITAGTVIDDTTLHYVTWSPDTRVMHQQLASMIADDLLLVWHPPTSAPWLSKTSSKPAPFALMQNDVEPQTASGLTRFTWEPFPSERMLQGSGVSAADISNVEYEIRIQHTELKEYAFSLFPSSPHAIIYAQDGIEEPLFTVPFVMPSCASIIWSVRAHFTLNGHARVTEWAGSYYNSLGMVVTTVMSRSTLPPHIYRRSQPTEGWQNLAARDELMHHSRIGTITEVVPPRGIDCEDLDWGVLHSEDKQAEGDFAGHIMALQSGEALGATAVIDRQCSSDNCEFETGTEDVTPQLTACLSREFRRRKMDTSIVAISAERDTPADVRYILDTSISLKEGGTTRQGQPDVMTLSSKGTAYSASFEARVIDAESGETLGMINSAHRASKGRFVAFFMVLPIMYFPYGSVSEIQDKACDELARYTSFVFRGGVSMPFPFEHFRTEADPLW